LVYKKGFDILIDAFAKLQKETDNNLHLVVVGSGAKREQLSKQAAGLWVHFLGSKSHPYIMQAIDNCEFFVCPSREEPFGIVNLEAMARGKAVISSNVGGVPEYLKNEENGLLVKPEDTKLLYTAMNRLYSD